MKLKFYHLLAFVAIILQTSAQSIPSFTELTSVSAVLIGNTHGDTVRMTPANPNNYKVVESSMFALPARGTGVAGVRFGLHGADGGTATYRELTGGPWKANAGAGATIWLTMNLNQGNSLFGTSTSYGLPFFVTYGKNGQPGTGYYQPCAGGGGGSTGMAWIVPGSGTSNYVSIPLSSEIIAIAAGGGGGEIINANLQGAGNGGGVTLSYLSPIQTETSTCPPYSLQAAAGASIMGYADYTGTGYDPCLWGTISESQPTTFQASSTQLVCVDCNNGGAGVALTSLTIGQPGGQACAWTGGPPPPTGGNDVNVFNLGCGGETLVNYGFSGGSGFTGGGASSEAFNNWVGAGGGGTGTDRYGAPGYITFGVFTQSINPAYGGGNYTGYGSNVITNNGGQTGNSASGWFEYYTLPDTTAPVVHVRNITVYLNSDGTVNLTPAELNNGITDNDSVQSITVNPSVLTCNNQGANTVTVTATDFAGNHTNATATVTVIDTLHPIIPPSLYRSPDDIHQLGYTQVGGITIANYVNGIPIDVSGGPVNVIDYYFQGVSNACGSDYPWTISYPATTFDCSEIGTYQNVILTATGSTGRTTTVSVPFYIYSSVTNLSIYVDSSATGANNGTSWTDAYTSLQDALDYGCTQGRTIYVAKGTYYPDHGFDVVLNNQSMSFTLRNGDQIYGGFPSGGDVFDNRDPKLYPVSLSGNIGDPSQTSDNSYKVLTIPAGVTGTHIEGVTICNGSNDLSLFPYGSGVDITSSQVSSVPIAQFISCTFSNNYSLYGGGVSFTDASAAGSVDFENCIFSNNSSFYNGGGVIINGSTLANTEATFTNCAFIKNVSNYGAGIYISNSAAVITNCSFSGNSAGSDGGALYVAGNNPLVRVYNTVMYADSAFTSPEIYESPAKVNIYYSDIQGSGGSSAWNGTAGIDYGHNIDANPQFLLGPTLQISPSSPCRNKGYNGFNNLSIDLNNLPRIIQDTIDMGAYETDAIVYVAWDVPNGGDGISWATAFNKLQDGLDASYVQGYFKDIWIKTGTYYPTKSYASGTDQGRQNTFVVTYSDRLFGGFAGNEVSFNRRNVAANPTILSGDLGVQGDSTDNAYHVITLNQSINPRLDGLIIQDGNADLASANFDYGGAVYCSGSSAGIPTPTFVNCVFRNNHALTAGGAIDCAASPTGHYTLSFIQNIFYNNSTNGSGGAIFVNDIGGVANNVMCNLYNCTATGNSASVSGGFGASKCVLNTTDTASINLYNTIVWGDTVSPITEFSVLAGNGKLNNYNSTIGGANPVFVNRTNPAGADGLIMTADDGLRLQSSSPYINGGSNAYLSTGNPNDSLYDVTGGARIQQRTVDMGSYENWGCLGFTSLYVDSRVQVSGLGNSWNSAFKYLQEALNVSNVCPQVDTIYVAQGIYYPNGFIQQSTNRDTSFYISKPVTIIGGYPNFGGQRNITMHPTILDGNINSLLPIDNVYHIMVVNCSTSADTTVIDGCTFRNGYANGIGTRIYPGPAPFSRSSGAAISEVFSKLVVRNCTFVNNYASQGGGAIDEGGGFVSCIKNIFSTNSANYGGAIRTETSSGSVLIADNNIFSSNSSTLGGGGALSLAMAVTPAPYAQLINNVFVQNKTDAYGGAMVIDGGNSDIYNNTFYADSAPGNGGAIDILAQGNLSNLNIYNNIFYKNYSGTGTTDYYLTPGGSSLTQGNNSFSNTNPIFYNESNLIGPDNTWGTSDDGLELKKTSPLINQGNNTIASYSTDVTGAPRIRLGVVDPGAFEADSEITRWYVSVGQDSVTGDGTSWAKAFPQFMQGVNAAKPGDTVWVAEGTYTPASGTAFNMKSSVQIYGGFNATETQLSQRLLDNGYNTILQGNGSNVVYNDSVNTSAVLDGFVIENGSSAVGAGMENFYSSPQVRNCVFANNSASQFGGGMTCSYGSPTLTNVVFYNNKVTGVGAGGGAMYSTNGSTPIIRNCDFVNNRSSFNGGALYANSLGHYSISNSAFTGNTAANLYDDNFYGLTQNVSHCLLQTGNPDSGNIISTNAGMLDPANAPGQDGLWFTGDDGLQLVYSTSNLINRGINDSVINQGSATDIIGAARIQNGTVDIGAYESRTYNYCDSAAFNGIHILYVDGNRPVSGNGYSWKTAFLTLNEALDKANYCTAFDTILVAAGTYYPTDYQADTNRNLSFTILRSGYEVLGGYPNGGGTRNLGANNTTLSGDIGVADTNFDNSYHVLVFKNVDNTGGIDGFIITAGAANSPNGDANGNGGGAWINGSGAAGYCKPRITNCVFTANEAYYGGAVINDAQQGGNSSPTFINCVFAKNICDLGLGGAMYNVASYNGISMPVITNCTFSENTCSGVGGGIYDDCALSGTVTVTLKNTILWGNTSNNGLADQQFTGNGCTSTASYCIIQGGLSGSLADGGHNLYTNPFFADSARLPNANGDWMTTGDGLNIYGGSPAVNAGNALGAPAADITGAARIGLPDIGAYENPCSGTIYDTLNITACDSALSPSHRYWWTTSGLHRDTTLTLAGCDTAFVVNLTLGHSTNTAISATACGSFTSPDGLHIWDTSGVYADTLTGFAGCDSIVTVRLTILHATNSSISASTCSSYISPSGHQTWTSTGVYTDTLQNVAGCDSIISINLTVTDINDSATATGAVCTALQTGAIYQWIDCSNSQAVVGATSRTFTATQNGNYKCAVSLSNCTDTTNCVAAVALGISDITAYHFQLYPNPNNGKFIIESNYTGELQIQIVSTLGDKVAEFTLAKPTAQFDVSELASGVYQVFVRADKQLMETLRFVKQ